jgi:hypothetical protein
VEDPKETIKGAGGKRGALGGKERKRCVEVKITGVFLSAVCSYQFDRR